MSYERTRTVARRAAAALGLVLIGAVPAWAGSCTIGTGASVCVPANTTKPYKLVAIGNQSATATISVTDDGSTPAIGAAGSWDIAPGATRIWGNGVSSFSGAFQAISSAGATPVTYTAQ